MRRPILSISTNGTLIDDAWAEKIVGIPFQGVTISIDGATPETYARLRRGADLNRVLANVRRIQILKEERNSRFPDLDFFFLVMKSNYREIPLFLELASEMGIERISLQLLLVDDRNLSREPQLASEVDFSQAEAAELHHLTHTAFERHRGRFRSINVSGLHTLFEAHNLETTFINEGRCSIYPDNPAPADVEPESNQSPARDEIDLCPNPWTLMYVTETGDVHVCFMARAIGNVFETPLIRIWNSPNAVGARHDIISGRYHAAGCSSLWCSWREGKTSAPSTHIPVAELMEEFKALTQRALAAPASEPDIDSAAGIASVRRMLAQRNQRIGELEGNLVCLCEKNQAMLDSAARQYSVVSARVMELERLLRFTSGERVEVPSDVRFGKGRLRRFAKKAAIGAAIRSIRALEWGGNRLRRFVNWTCRDEP